MLSTSRESLPTWKTTMGLRNLVTDKLLVKLDEDGLTVTGYADDVKIMVEQEWMHLVLAQNAVTKYHKKKQECLTPLKVQDELSMSTEVKYSVCKLRWNQQVNNVEENRNVSVAIRQCMAKPGEQNVHKWSRKNTETCIGDPIFDINIDLMTTRNN